MAPLTQASSIASWPATGLGTCLGTFWFDVNEEELEKRILERSKTSGRNDDNAETLRKRFAQFKTEQMPIINKYAEMGKIRKIDGARDIEVVYADVKAALAGYF